MKVREKFDPDDQECLRCIHLYYCELCNDLHCAIEINDPLGTGECQFKEVKE